MPFVRVTIARPRPDVREEVRLLFNDLITATADLPGFISGYVMESHHEIGRITFWDSQVSANRAASDARVLAIHSRLIPDNPGDIQDWDMTTSLAIEGQSAQ